MEMKTRKQKQKSLHPGFAVNRQLSTVNPLLKRIQPRNIHAGYQQVNIVGALVCNYGFEVHEVAHNGVFAGNAHAAQYLARIAGNIERNFAAIALSGHVKFPCRRCSWPSFFNTPKRQTSNWALVISVIISASFFCCN